MAPDKKITLSTSFPGSYFMDEITVDGITVNYDFFSFSSFIFSFISASTRSFFISILNKENRLMYTFAIHTNEKPAIIYPRQSLNNNVYCVTKSVAMVM